MDNISVLIEKLNPSFDNALKLSDDGQAIYVPAECIVKLMDMLKNQYEYVMLADLSAVEYEDRYEVVYHVMKLTDAQDIRIKVALPLDAPTVPSIVDVWKAANVQEREAFDLMGIRFSGHPDLRRILCPDDFNGHPLRKSFNMKTVSRF
ncbi:MAG: NADH-quinone oxidoreductase subunit C [Clostridiales bacterium]|jgi:NADH-quinone oxidoreductase subunit C|nr:NADH-quinone oxidoreductase subunit C [Eubacteriales bacterium]MDH7566363.1 NADH-quinone oxidoreductase subunit C [Clostridiales bacterium]